MLPILLEKRAEIAALCRAYRITRLEVFGSAMTDEFDPERSDIDLLAYFAPDAQPDPWYVQHMKIEADFASIVGRDVDIVMPTALDDPFFRYVANLTRTVIHDAAEDGGNAEPDRGARDEDPDVLRRAG